MAVIAITHIQAPQSQTNDTIQQAVQSVRELSPRHFTIGTRVQDNRTVQITSEWAAGSPDDTDSPSPSPSMGRSFNVALNRSAFSSDGPATATANVVEFAQSYFPASRITPEFQRQIEGDFLRFEEICSGAAEGNLGLAFGWVLEEQEHGEVVGEKAKCFLVVRGWESMDAFEWLVGSEAYREAVQILFAWGVPFEMVSFRSFCKWQNRKRANGA